MVHLSFGGLYPHFDICAKDELLLLLGKIRL